MSQDYQVPPTYSPLDDEQVYIENWNNEFDQQQTNNNNETTQPSRLLTPSFTDKAIGIFSSAISMYASIFGLFFGVSYLAINAIVSITLLGLKYGYTMDNIRAIIGQARLETGDFTSPMAKEDNNIFGMHYPYSRNTYSTDSRYNSSEFSQVARYPSLACSILDRFYWERQWIALPIKPDMETSVYMNNVHENYNACLLYTSPSPRDH